MTQAVIRVEALQKRYRRGQIPAVRGVSFEVHQGQIFGLIGPDGAGKTSVLQILAGVLSASGGTAAVAGIDAIRQPEAVKPLIGYMPQGLGLNLYDSLTVEENIAFFRDLRQMPEAPYRTNRDRLLAMTRLAPFLNRRAGQLSGGMRQKLALICTLIHLPDILLLDEPTTGVDPLSRRDFWTIIQDLVTNRAVTVLLTTAYMDEAERCRRVAVMHEGEIIAAGSPDTLVAELPGRMISVSVADPRRVVAAFAGSPAVESAAVFGNEAHILLREGVEDADVVERLTNDGLTQARVHTVPAGLEDVYVHALAARGTSAEALSGVAVGRRARANTTAIRARGLTRRFDGFTAVDQVTLEIGAGEIFGLLGPNGAGKTTLIKMFTGLLEPSGGTAEVAGLDIVADRQALRGRFGYMSQRFSLYQDLPVFENLRLYAGLYGLSHGRFRAAADALLGAVGLAAYAHSAVQALPLGLRQRLALACALLHEPDVLFLDEPTSGVDPIMRRQFWNLVHGLAQDGHVTVVVSTHYMDEAEHCRRLGLMQNGRLVAVGSPGDLRVAAEQRRGPVVAVQAPDFAAAFHLLRGEYPNATLYGRRIQWQSLSAETDLAHSLAMLSATGIAATGATLPLTMEETFASFLEAEHV